MIICTAIYLHSCEVKCVKSFFISNNVWLLKLKYSNIYFYNFIQKLTIFGNYHFTQVIKLLVLLPLEFGKNFYKLPRPTKSLSFKAFIK